MKAFNTKTLALITSLILAVGAVTAVQPQPQKSINAESPNIDTTEGEIQDGLLSGVDLSFLLSSLSGPDQVSPGSDITFDASVEATQTFDIGGKVKVTEIYKCQDSTCDNGEFVEAESSTIAFDAELTEGTEYAWVTTYTTPESPEGYYVATSYISDGAGTVLTDSPEHKFIVGSVPVEEQPVSPDVDIESGPSISVDRQAGTVEGRITLTNNGDGDMVGTDIVEMQVRPAGEGPLSFVSTQQTCDSQYPNNVHKEFSLESGETATVSLTADQLEQGQDYQVFFLTRDACYPDNERVEPIPNSINAGSFNLEEGQTGTGGPQVSRGVIAGVVFALIGVLFGVYYFVTKE